MFVWNTLLVEEYLMTINEAIKIAEKGKVDYETMRIVANMLAFEVCYLREQIKELKQQEEE